MRNLSNTVMLVEAAAVLLLSFVSVSRSVPLACEDLLRPLGQPHLRGLEGRRTMVAGSISHLPFMELLRSRDSATAEFSNNGDESSLFFRRSGRSDGNCYYASYNVTLEGSSFTLDDINITTTFVHTSCHDCILLKFDVESGKRQHFYLFSKRRQLEEMEIEEFRDQATCLNIPPPVVMDPSKEVCPEQHTTDHKEDKTEAKSN
ncbi:uncharacterized protein LOC103468584 [Poecilia reticulata]|uniref:uncharacterized protein LOC103468584 n=1 Tax=Poecilia reticulata TaxID=8081 RepID=UPI0004A36528|nr:PREDICTED: uncharacterized protein LOC103468584 [Poecilia reticulata]